LSSTKNNKTLIFLLFWVYMTGIVGTPNLQHFYNINPPGYCAFGGDAVVADIT